MTGACCLCAQIAGEPSGDLLHAFLGGPYTRRVIDLGDDLVAMPSLGSLVPGHVLVCPTTHARSFAELPPEQLQKAPHVLDRLADSIVPAAGAQFFEHGDAKTGTRISCSVEHAHVHVLPGVPDLWPAARGLAGWQPLMSFEDLPTLVGSGEYLLLRARATGWFVAGAPRHGFPSQLLRRVVAESLGNAEAWNWRDHPALEPTSASWRLLQTRVTTS